MLDAMYVMPTAVVSEKRVCDAINTMGEKRKSLALMNVHRNIDIDIEKVIDKFALKHPRRMLLLDILNGDGGESE